MNKLSILLALLVFITTVNSQREKPEVDEEAAADFDESGEEQVEIRPEYDEVN